MNDKIPSAEPPPSQLRKRVLFASVLVTLSGIIYFYQYHRAEPIHRELEQEFARVTPALNSLPISHESTFKAGTALVQTEYKTNVSFAEVRAHYESELERNGWRFDSHQTKDQSEARSGLEEIVFCKGTYAASVSRRDRDLSDSKFWFALSWGLHDCR